MFLESEEKSLRSAACSLPGFIRQLRKQLCHRFFQDRMTQIRCDFRHRLQYEIPQMHFHMRHDQSIRLKYLLIVQKNIQIQRPWTPVNLSLSVRCLLDHMHLIKQLLRFQQRAQAQTCIQEIRLLHTAVRLCNQIRRNLFHLASRKRIQCQHCPVQISLAVPDIRTEGNVRRMPESRNFYGYRIERQSNRRPRLFQFQCNTLDERVLLQNRCGKSLSCRLDQFTRAAPSSTP